MMGEFASSEYYVATTRRHYIQVCDRGKWLWFQDRFVDVYSWMFNGNGADNGRVIM
jgi:hypothetical protein